MTAVRAALLACVIAVVALMSACGGPRSAKRPAAWSSGELLVRARASLTAGDHGRAEQYAILAIERGHAIDATLPVLLAACIAGDRYEHALLYATRYRDAVGDPTALGFLVANLTAAVETPAAAIRALDELLARPDAPVEAYFLRGVLNQDEIGDEAAASADLRRYLEAAPSGPHRRDAERRLRRVAP